MAQMKRSLEKIRQLVIEAIRNQLPAGFEAFSDTTYDDSVVYFVDDGKGTKYFQRDYAISDSGEVSLGVPVEVERIETYRVVGSGNLNFSAVRTLENGDVEVDATIFKLGDYPDKQFSLDESEAASTVASTARVPILIEHLDTPFTKKNKFSIGELVKKWVEGDLIKGTLRFSKWAAEALKGEAPSLSVGFNAAKLIDEISLVTSPRITEARLAAAFNDKPSDERIGAGMNPIEIIKALFSKLTAEERADVLNSAPQGSNPTFTATPPEIVERERALQQRIDSLETDKRNAQAGLVKQAATVLAAKFSGRAPGKSQDNLVPLFEAAIVADGTNGLVTFSADGQPAQGDNVGRLTTFLESLPDIGGMLTSDSGLTQLSALFSGDVPSASAEAPKLPDLSASAIAQLKGGK
jgi:hypothetical protein